MSLVTLTVLEKFLSTVDKDWLYLSELTQLESKIKNSSPAPQAGRELDLIAELKKAFSPGEKITKSALTQKINDILTTHNYNYIKRRHSSCFNNIFYSKVPEIKYYDLAFYHEKCPIPAKKTFMHHSTADCAGVFYMRVEENPATPDTIMFGNLQQDIKTSTAWTDAALGKILLRPKNIDREMLHQAIMHAVTRGKSKIQFHAGEGLQVAQGWSPKLRKFKATSRKFKEYQADYERKLKDYDQLEVGDGVMNHIVIEKNEKYITTVSHQSFVDRFLTAVYYNRWGFPEKAAAAHKKELARAHKEFCQPTPCPRKVLAHLNAFFAMLIPATKLLKPTPGILFQLKTFIEPGDGFYGKAHAHEFVEFAARCEYFLEHHGYIDAVLAAHPNVLVPHQTGFCKGYLLVKFAEQDKTNFYRAQIKPPVLGETFCVQGGPYNYRSILEELSSPDYVRREIYRKYEEGFPQLLKKLGLTCKKVSIESVDPKNQRKRHGEAWEIISGLAEYKTKPHPLF